MYHVDVGIEGIEWSCKESNEAEAVAHIVKEGAHH